MKTYEIRLSTDAIVSTTVIIEAETKEDAEEQALNLDHDLLDWEVGSLHEEPTVHETRIQRTKKANP